MNANELFSSSSSNLPLLLSVAAVFVLAGLVKGVIGLGLPTISMALLASMMNPAEAAALLVVPSFITNVWQLQPWRSLRDVSWRMAPMQVGVVVGTLGGAWVIGAPVGAWAVVCLGAMLIVYAAWVLAGARLSVAPGSERWLGPVVGASTGLVTAATGVFVVPAVPYLQALGLQKEALIQAMGLSFTVSTVALAAGLCLNGHFPSATVGASLLMLLPALAGMALGTRLRQRISQDRFRKCFLASLLLLGSYMIVREMLQA
ncbi:MAG: sulfite exporter TauE/SafE family protein [Proteobacteria bacterium]|nr:sulfite exporter TauE/SafE family protein [Pseudomonadota bacterium]